MSDTMSSAQYLIAGALIVTALLRDFIVIILLLGGIISLIRGLLVKNPKAKLGKAILAFILVFVGLIADKGILFTRWQVLGLVVLNLLVWVPVVIMERRLI